MAKRKIEIEVVQPESETPAMASYTIYELTGFRVYTNVASDTGLELADLETTLAAELAGLDA